MNYDGPNVDPIDDWLEVQRGYALQRLEDARAAVQQIAATVMHNPTDEWLDTLKRCKQALAAAEETVAQFDLEQQRTQAPKL